jgi:hypothetical protein
LVKWTDLDESLFEKRYLLMKVVKYGMPIEKRICASSVLRSFFYSFDRAVNIGKKPAG